MEVTCESLPSEAAQRLETGAKTQMGDQVNWPNLYLPVVSSYASSLWPSSTEAVRGGVVYLAHRGRRESPFRGGQCSLSGRLTGSITDWSQRLRG